jgi:PAS domain S-box-containing protein
MLKTTKVLFVGDNLDHYNLVTSLLKREINFNFLVSRANSLNDALELLINNKYNVLILNIDPLKDNFHILCKLNDLFPDIPKVIISTDHDPEIMLKGFENGADDYLIIEELNSTALARTLCFAISRINAKKSSNDKTKNHINSEKLKKDYEEIYNDLKIKQIDIEIKNNDLKNSQQKLEDIKQKVFELFDLGPLGYFTLDANGLIMGLNLTGSHILGKEMNELIQKPFISFLESESRLIFNKLMESARNSGNKQKEEIELEIGKETIPVILEIMALFNDKGDFKEYLITLSDITKQKNGKKKLIDTSIHLKAIYDMAGISIGITKTNGQWIQVNQHFQDLLGYSEEELLKITNYDITHPDDLSESKENISKLLSGEIDSYRTEKRYKTKDGEFLWMDLSVTPLKDEEGNIIALIGAGSSINQQKITEEYLLKSVEHLRMALDSSNAGTYDWNMKTGKLVWSPELFKLFGLPDKSEATFEIWLDIMNPDDRERAMAKINHAIKEHEFLENEYRIIRGDGKEIWINALGETFYNEQDEPVRMTGICVDITPRKIAQDTLKLSERNYRELVENSLVGIYKTNLDGEMLFANDALVKMLEYDSFEDIKSKKTSDLYKDPNVRLSFIKQLKEIGYIDQLEAEMVSKNGKTINTLISGSLNSNIITGMMLDITQRRKAEESLSKSQDRYKTLYRSITEGLALHEVIYNGHDVPTDYIILDVNPAYEEIIGIKGNDIVGKPASEIYGTGKPPYIEIYSEVAETGISRNFESYFEPMGKYFRISVFSPRKGTFVTAFEDITDRKNDEKEIAKLAAIVTSSQDAIISWNLDGEITSWNNGAENIYGYTEKEIIKNNISILMPPKQSDELTDLINNIKNGNQIKNFETVRLRKDGTKIDVSLTISPIKDIAGRIIGASTIAHDITENKNRRRNINASLKEKEVLLREIHHRVKNNMQIISSLLNLQIQYLDEEETVNVLMESQNRVKSMAIIHEKLYQSNDLNSIKIAEYVDSLVKDLFYSFNIKSDRIKSIINVEDIKLNIETAIPCGLIINELVTNSLKYAFPNGKNGEISVSIHSTKEGYELVIADNGIGFPKELDFEKTDSLGLQLVNNLTEQIDGTIELERFNGTNFTINFKQLIYKERV